MKKLVIVLGFLLAFASCDKKQDENVDEEICELLNLGYITVHNSSNNPYTLYVDDLNVGVISGNDYKKQSVSPGIITFKLVQNSGYFIVPTVYETTLTVRQCDELSWKP